MTGAENLMNTVINSLSMIDRGFTVTLTVQPHDWDYDGDDYDEEMGDDLGEMHKSDGAKWPKVGDEVWYKTRHGNHERGKVKVVCHNTIQLGNNVTLERRHCIVTPFKVGDEVYFDWCGHIKHGTITEIESFDRVKCRTLGETYFVTVKTLFDSVDDLLHYLKSTADE